MNSYTKNLDVNGIRIISLRRNSIPPGNISYPMNSSYSLRVCSILQGRGVWRVGKKTYPIEKGDIFVFSNYEYRALKTVYPPENLETLALAFEPKIIWSNHCDLFDINYLKIFFERKSSFSNRIEGTLPAAHQAYDLMLEIQRETEESLAEHHQMVKAQLLTLLALLNRYYVSIDAVKKTSELTSRQHLEGMNRVLDYIEIHLSEQLSLSQLADLVPMNPSYFSRFFKRYNGLGLTQYIYTKRIQRAITYLENEDKTILEVSTLCGFNNTSSFYKAFKKVTGSHPTAYLKSKS